MAGEIFGRSVATRRRGGDASGSQGSVPGESVGGSVPCEADGSRSLGVEEGAPSSSSAAAAATVSPLSVRGVDEGDRATEMMSLRERRSSEDRPGQVVSGSVRRVRLGVEEGGTPSSSSAAAAATVSPLSVRAVDEGTSATEMPPLRERSSSKDKPDRVVSGPVQRVKLRGIDTSSDEEGGASNVGDCAKEVPLSHKPVASVERRVKLRGIDTSSEEGPECVASRPVRRVKLPGIDTSSDEEGDASNVGDCATAVPLPHEPVASVGRRTKLRGIDSSSEDGQECVASRSVRQVKLRGIDTSSDEQGDASPRRLRKGVKLRGLDTSSDEERQQPRRSARLRAAGGKGRGRAARGAAGVRASGSEDPANDFGRLQDASACRARLFIPRTQAAHPEFLNVLRQCGEPCVDGRDTICLYIITC